MKARARFSIQPGDMITADEADAQAKWTWFVIGFCYSQEDDVMVRVLAGGDVRCYEVFESELMAYLRAGSNGRVYRDGDEVEVDDDVV